MALQLEITVNGTDNHMATLVSGIETDFDVLSAQRGDREAFACLLRRHEKSLDAHLARFTSNGADLQDLRQETYLEAFRSLSTYKHQGPFGGWLRRIATRVGYRYWSGKAKDSRAKGAYIELLEHLAPVLSPLSHQDGAERARAILVGLPREDRALLEMRYLHGLKAVEIAKAIGWNVSRVRVRLHRAIKRLRIHPPAKG